MLTYEMIGLADENGKTYECDWGTYSKKDGFKFPNLPFGDSQNFVEDFANQLLHSNVWKLQRGKKMTLEDIEKELGYKIELCDSCDTNTNKEDDAYAEHVVEFFKDVLGIDLK